MTQRVFFPTGNFQLGLGYVTGQNLSYLEVQVANHHVLMCAPWAACAISWKAHIAHCMFFLEVDKCREIPIVTQSLEAKLECQDADVHQQWIA